MKAAARAVGLFLDPWPPAVRSGPPPGTSWGHRFRRAVFLKANPRTEEYMKALFDERWPGGDFVRIDGRGEWNGLLSGAGMVVLLYPDAIGLGFGEVENQVEKLKAEGTPVMVLNGRHREFVLDRPRRRRLRLRRFLERTMAGEFAALVPFVVATPLLLLLDRVRGRR